MREALYCPDWNRGGDQITVRRFFDGDSREGNLPPHRGPADHLPEAGDHRSQYFRWRLHHVFVHDPTEFQTNNVLYHYPVNGDRLTIGKFCSIARGAKFLFTSANHTLRSLSTYPFPLFFEEWGLEKSRITDAWDNRGDIVVGNDVWIGYETVILSGVTIGDGAVIGARAVVTRDVPPYTIVGGVPAKPIRPRFDPETTAALLELRWWDWPRERIRRNLPAIQAGRLDLLQ